MSDREALRSQTTELLQRLRSESNVPQALFDLLGVVVSRLDRIELGEFESQEETPTEPARRVSGANIAAVKPDDLPLGERTKAIFDRAKKDGE